MAGLSFLLFGIFKKSHWVLFVGVLFVVVSIIGFLTGKDHQPASARWVLFSNLFVLIFFQFFYVLLASMALTILAFLIDITSLGSWAEEYCLEKNFDGETCDYEKYFSN